MTAADETAPLSEHVTVRFPDALIAAARQVASAEGMDVSAWIRREVEREAARRAAAQEQPVPEPSRTEWAVFWGGESPDDCAGWDSRDDEADAEEHRERITGGGVACRTVAYGPWTVTIPPPPPDRGLSGDWSDEELAEFRRRREQKEES